jgi:hypothetical protein
MYYRIDTVGDSYGLMVQINSIFTDRIVKGYGYYKIILRSSNTKDFHGTFRLGNVKTNEDVKRFIQTVENDLRVKSNVILNDYLDSDMFIKEKE